MSNRKQDTPVFDVGKTETRKDTNRALPFHTTYDQRGALRVQDGNNDGAARMNFRLH